MYITHMHITYILHGHVMNVHKSTHTHKYVSMHCIDSMCAYVLNRFNHVWLWVTLWIVSVGLCRQEYWSGLPCPSPGDRCRRLRIEPESLMSPALAGRVVFYFLSFFFTTNATWEVPMCAYIHICVCMPIYMHMHVEYFTWTKAPWDNRSALFYLNCPWYFRKPSLNI